MSIAKFFLDAAAATAQTAVQMRGAQPSRPGQRPVACTPCGASALRAKANQQFLPRGYTPPRRAR